MSPGKRAALYARVSTRDKEQDPENQFIVLREWAVRQGFETVEFSDYATGKNLNRPGWQRMMRDVKAGRIDVVAVVRIDRAFRSVPDMRMVLESLEARGVRFASTTQDIDTRTALGKYFITSLGAIAELEGDLISERVKEGLARARKEGKRLGRPRKVGQRRLEDAVKRSGVRGAARELGISPAAVSQRVKKTQTVD